MPHALPLVDLLDRRTSDGAIYETLPEGRVRCLACGHRCLIPPGRRGICQVRFNRDGRLQVPHGYVAGLAVDPIEKKPFYHVLPGARALSFGMLGCDLHCAYCQNWISSQTLRDPRSGGLPEEIAAEDVVELARRHRAPVITSTYNEPLITSEWAAAIFRPATAAGLLCGYVSNGNGTPEVLDYLGPLLRICKVDLKTFRDKGYRGLGGTLDAVLKTITELYRRGTWLEVVTLLVPGFNDSPEELRDMARFLVSVSPDVPWHLTAFHPDYKMDDRPATSPQQLVEAAGIGRAEGLRFVYAGNLPGMTGDLEHTVCPQCGGRLVERHGFRVVANRMAHDGKCPDCRTQIPGVWALPAPPLSPRD
jgi:pyruvate formate lyase activating enzyme